MQSPTQEAQELYKQAEKARAACESDQQYDSSAKKEAFLLYEKASTAFAEMNSLTEHESRLFDNCIYRAGQLSFDPRAPNFRVDFRRSHQTEEEKKENKPSRKTKKTCKEKEKEPEILPSFCALCRQRSNLAEATSHIWPEFLLRWAEELQHTTPHRTRLVASPSELKRKLLCRRCETTFSEFEGYAKVMFFDPFKKIYDEGSSTLSTITLEHTKKLLPSAFYKFLVSLFWRHLAVGPGRDAWERYRWTAFESARAFLLGETEEEPFPLFAFFADTLLKANKDFDRLTYVAFCVDLQVYHATVGEGQVDFMFLAMRGCHVMFPLSKRAKELIAREMEMCDRFRVARVSKLTTSIAIQADGERFTPTFLRQVFEYHTHESASKHSRVHFKPHHKTGVEKLRKTPQGALSQRLLQELGTNRVALPIPQTGARPLVLLPLDVYYSDNETLPFQLKGGCPGCCLEKKSPAIRGVQLYLRTCFTREVHRTVLCDLDALRPRLVMACRLVKHELELVAQPGRPLLEHLKIPKDGTWTAIEAAIKKLLSPGRLEEGTVEVVKK